MRVIGLAGRAGSGKSTIARHLAQRQGIEWIDLDTVAWGIYAAGTPAYERLLEAFGASILSKSGEIDRIQLAEAAFSSRENQKTLNAIVHPAVSDAVEAIVSDHEQRGTEILLIEGALLASSPHVDRSIYDLILWLDVPDTVRDGRLQDIGRGDHAKRGRDVYPTGDVVTIPAEGSIKDVAARIFRAIDATQT